VSERTRKQGNTAEFFGLLILRLGTGYWQLGTSLDAQLFDFLVVVLAVEDGPLLGAFDDGPALAFDFLAAA